MALAAQNRLFQALQDGFRLLAQDKLEQYYTIAPAATVMNVCKSTLDKWGRQVKDSVL